MNKSILALAYLILFHIPVVHAGDFNISFEWGDIPLCTSGSPNNVPNPIFKLSDVPEGTKFIYFKLTDKDVPGYKHGGGVVEFSGQNVIEPGAFKYQSPCPPSGSHTYEWQATAKSKKSLFGGKIGQAKASVKYPN